MSIFSGFRNIQTTIQQDNLGVGSFPVASINMSNTKRKGSFSETDSHDEENIEDDGMLCSQQSEAGDDNKDTIINDTETNTGKSVCPHTLCSVNTYQQLIAENVSTLFKKQHDVYTTRNRLLVSFFTALSAPITEQRPVILPKTVALISFLSKLCEEYFDITRDMIFYSNPAIIRFFGTLYSLDYEFTLPNKDSIQEIEAFNNIDLYKKVSICDCHMGTFSYILFGHTLSYIKPILEAIGCNEFVVKGTTNQTIYFKITPAYDEISCFVETNPMKIVVFYNEESMVEFYFSSTVNITSKPEEYIKTELTTNASKLSELTWLIEDVEPLVGVVVLDDINTPTYRIFKPDTLYANITKLAYHPRSTVPFKSGINLLFDKDEARAIETFKHYYDIFATSTGKSQFIEYFSKYFYVSGIINSETGLLISDPVCTPTTETTNCIYPPKYEYFSSQFSGLLKKDTNIAIPVLDLQHVSYSLADFKDYFNNYIVEIQETNKSSLRQKTFVIVTALNKHLLKYGIGFIDISGGSLYSLIDPTMVITADYDYKFYYFDTCPYSNEQKYMFDAKIKNWLAFIACKLKEELLKSIYAKIKFSYKLSYKNFSVTEGVMREYIHFCNMNWMADIDNTFFISRVKDPPLFPVSLASFDLMYKFSYIFLHGYPFVYSKSYKHPVSFLDIVYKKNFGAHGHTLHYGNYGIDNIGFLSEIKCFLFNLNMAHIERAITLAAERADEPNPERAAVLDAEIVSSSKVSVYDVKVDNLSDIVPPIIQSFSFALAAMRLDHYSMVLRVPTKLEILLELMNLLYLPEFVLSRYNTCKHQKDLERFKNLLINLGLGDKEIPGSDGTIKSLNESTSKDIFNYYANETFRGGLKENIHTKPLSEITLVPGVLYKLFTANGAGQLVQITPPLTTPPLITPPLITNNIVCYFQLTNITSILQDSNISTFNDDVLSLDLDDCFQITKWANTELLKHRKYTSQHYKKVTIGAKKQKGGKSTRRKIKRYTRSKHRRSKRLRYRKVSKRMKRTRHTRKR